MTMPNMRLFGMVNGVPPPLYPFTNFTFTGFIANSGTGQVGPSLYQLQALSIYNFVAYPWLNNTAYFNVIGNGYQIWTVPATGIYSIDAYGAAGGGYLATLSSGAGPGARIKGEFFLTAGTKLRIVVGQRGSPGAGSTFGGSGGGGGGTFVMKETGTTDADIYVIAGGGGGGTEYGGAIAIAGGGSATSGNGAGGAAGSGTGGNGGGSILNNGNTSGYGTAGQSFITNAWGGNANASGFGGFGGGGGNGFSGGGGGGGYTGGKGADNGAASPAIGGGSFNNGTNQINTASANINAGQVIITRL